MWTRVCLIAFVALCCRSVSAEAPDVAAMPEAALSSAEFRPIDRVAGYWTLDYATGKITPGIMPLRAAVVYDNTTSPTGSGHAVPVVPDDPNYAVGDSLWMAGDGLLDSLAFSIFNSDTSAGPLSSADVEINLYDAYDAVLGTITVNDLTISPALNPGDVGFFTVENLQAEGINLPYACMYTMLLTDVQGGANSAGQAIYDPPTIGESPDMFYEGPTDLTGTHSWYFNNDPVANFYFAVSVENPAPLEIIWDTGPTHTVVRDSDGVEVWLGYTSGDYPACAQRWAAMPFRITDAGTVIKEIQCFWWISDGYEADHVNYIIWNRTALDAPTSFDEVFAQGTLGPYLEGGRDCRAKPYADWVPYHTYDVNIAMPAGDYYVTIYAEGTYEGDPDPTQNALAWESGCNYVPEDLEQEFFWRSCTFPVPGFQQYTAPFSPPPEMTDPDDRWNLAYMFRGVVCLGDLNGDRNVDLTDLAILLSHYGMTSGVGYFDGDLNFDGQVNLTDLAMLLSRYGTSC